MTSSKFHFQEIDWVIYFPEYGNEGRKYTGYGVAFRNRRQGTTQPGVRINLENILEKENIKQEYPHTVSYFLSSSGKGALWIPKYLETRKLSNEADFFNFLNDLHI